jgi:hypothetical protein
MTLAERQALEVRLGELARELMRCTTHTEAARLRAEMLKVKDQLRE